MKWIVPLLAALAFAMVVSSSRRCVNLLGAAETNTPPAPIGVYDSRVIAYAHFWSAAHQRHIADLSKAAKAAKAAGKTERFQELEAELKSEQEKSHLQVFSTAPADDALAEIKARLPAIQKEAGVSNLISKWDEASLKKHARAHRIDVTKLLLREFKLDERKLNVARDIEKQKPIPLEKALELMREGKL